MQITIPTGWKSLTASCRGVSLLVTAASPRITKFELPDACSWSCLGRMSTSWERGRIQQRLINGKGFAVVQLRGPRGFAFVSAATDASSAQETTEPANQTIRQQRSTPETRRCTLPPPNCKPHTPPTRSSAGAAQCRRLLMRLTVGQPSSCRTYARCRHRSLSNTPKPCLSTCQGGSSSIASKEPLVPIQNSVSHHPT